jgi:hypothetical protein
MSPTSHDDYWSTIWLPAVRAVGDLEEAKTEITYASIAEQSGVDADAVRLLVDRLSKDGDGKQWIDGAYLRSMGGHMTVRLYGLGPLGLKAARGYPTQEALVAILEALAEEGRTEEERGVARRAAQLFRDLPAETVAAMAAEIAKRLISTPW